MRHAMVRHGAVYLGCTLGCGAGKLCWICTLGSGSHGTVFKEPLELAGGVWDVVAWDALASSFALL